MITSDNDDSPKENPPIVDDVDDSSNPMNNDNERNDT